MKYKHNLYTFLILFCAMFVAQNVVAQVTGDKYNETNASVTITHKAAKWFDLRSGISDAAKAMDTFDDDTKMFTLQDGKTEVQAAHTYMDTIYVHKGTSVSLEIPDKLGTNTSIKSYQRWHSFRTDGTFRTMNTEANEVWDLLTPAVSGTFFRYANGYVGYPKGANMYKVNFYVPTDEEFKAWFGEDAAKKYDNNFYLVACDVSSYTDYTKNFDRESSSESSFNKPQSDGNTYEPTLTHRVLFYIVTVDNRDTDHPTVTWQEGMGRLNDSAYQGGTLDEGKKYLEEYDISFPYTRVSDNTKELVALSKDAWSYAIPGVSKDADSDTLNISLQDNGSGITLATKELTGMTRIIQFNYPNKNNTDNTQYVNADNSKATIYVTKTVGGTTYNLARFNLTFIRDTRLLTQTQLEQIEDGTIQNENLKYYQFRTDKYLEQNYQLLTSLNFDYDPAVADTYGSASFYPFPLAWTSNSYSFYDGANNRDFNNSNKYPEWGFYSIMNDFMEGDHWTNGTKNAYAKPLPGSNYHMYIDASDRPGVIARLPFRRKLCKGSELFVTAWLKSAGWNASMADANMLFSIMGVKTDPVLGTVYEPIYRQSSSQVRRTDYLKGGMPGTGSDTNEWMQMYFSFVIDADADYDSYVLQIDNNSASTDGGDMYIDDIRVYIATPSAEVRQLDATCTNERTLMSIKLDWNRLLSRLGQEEGQDKMDAIDFCFVDKAKYDDYLAQNPGKFQEAIENSVVEVGDNTSDGGYNQKYNTLYFNLDFDKNTTYDDKPHPRLASQNIVNGKYSFYRTTDESGNKALAVDFYSDLTPNRAYMMLIQVNDGNEASSSDFQESINNDECGINTSFTVTAQTLLRVNGEVVDPSTDFCAGQIFNFSAQVRVPKQEDDGSESYIIVDKGVYFDWFFGTEAEYMQNDSVYGVSLEQALTTFREIYPDNEDLTGVEPGQHTVTGTSESIELTENMISVIKKYLLEDTGEADGAHNRLVLHKENLDITLLNSGLKLVIQPIPMIFPPDDTIDKDSWAKVCWNYVPLELNVSGDAPQLHAGFNPVQYPADDFNPCLRIGMDQIAETTADKPLRVDLRGAKYVSENATYIGMVTATSAEVYSKMYLIDTDDPAYKSKYFPEGFSEFSLPIGYIKSLHAQEYETGSEFNDYMEIYFDTETTQSNDFRFQPKEGYYYTFAVHFEEHGEEGSDVSNACFGKFTVKMKVVPEYLVWQGKDVATLNWNNDANWKRADAKDIKNTDGTYETNAANTTDNGFVPMLFSNVVMPKGSKAELYMAGYTNADGKQEWDSDRPSHMGLPTENIQYDLMAYDSNNTLTTQRYRVNICRDIHFEPGAQMLHAEQLLYNKAWTDVEITPGQWTAVSTPLQGVVAGDWYAPTATGRQETEYFKDINFTDGGYSRLNPAVYQRSWSTGANIVENLQGTNTPVSFTTEWSSAYNDASVPYVAGGGFSIKGVLKDATSLLFRFPKADARYDVSTAEDKSVDRTNAGKLLVSNMVDRRDPYTYVHSDKVTVTLTPSADGKYLMVGNPFMASLDVQAFVAANSDVLAQKYWIGDMSEDKAVAFTENGWSDQTSLIAPYSVFYVEALGHETEAETIYDANVTVKFTAAMQKFETTSTGEGSQTVSLKITAEDAEGSSSAAVRYAASASNGFGMEDAQMISGLTGNADNAPKVYTVAGNTAVSVNQLKDAQRIPLGVTAADGSVVTLTFSGVAAVKDAAIYDAELQSETPLYEGYQLTVNGPSYGRYFLIGHGSGTTGITETGVDGNVSVSSIVPRQVVVTSDTALRSVSVWSAGGALLKKVSPNGNFTCTLNGVDSGMVVVRTETESGSQVTKIRVR